MTEPQDLKLSDAVDQLLDEAEALGDLEGTMPLYERALTLDPDRAATHYDIGLVYKYRGAWTESLHHNRRASDLCDDDEATNWNMGIAARALRDWAVARETWRRVGIQIAEGDGPIEEDFGIAPVRLNPDDGGEVVWGGRIDPVRVVLEGIPYPASGFRAGDVVLHDGAPVGERQHNGRTYSVFNVLELFESSANSTYEAEVRARGHRSQCSDHSARHGTGGLRGLDDQCPHSLQAMQRRNTARARRRERPDARLAGQPYSWYQHDSPESARQVLERWSASGDVLLDRLVGRTGSNRLLRFECALTGTAVH